MMRRARSRPGHLRRAARRRTTTAVLAIGVVLWWSATASAQLDPLLFVKRVPPTVIVVLDTSLRMLEDGEGFYRDTNTYTVADDPSAATAIGVDATASQYRRKYQNFDWDGVADDNKKYVASDIVPVPDTSPDYGGFFAATRFEMAKAGIAAAVTENNQRARWGLIKLRQNAPAWRVSPVCDKPVTLSAPRLLTATDSAPCNASGPSKFAVYAPRVTTPNYEQTTLLGGLVVAPGPNTAAAVLDKVTRPLLDAQGLIPASRGGQGYADRPLTLALADARQAAVNAMSGDAASSRTCRNTVVVLVTGGKDSGSNTYLSQNNVESTASTFAAVSASGTTKRVPIHVISVKPAAVEEIQLRAVANNSGGSYTSARTAVEITAAINRAVQAGYSRAENFDNGTVSEYLPVSPIIGTVNLTNARDASGNALPNTDITANPGGQRLPQRSNVLLSSGFALPGFDGVLRAFRVYKPVADNTKPTGWKFVNDGTRLWPDLDGRPSLAGKGRTPADPHTRNIYTYLPDGSGGGSVVAFTPANADALMPHMRTGDAAATALAIAAVRAQPLGAIIGSTPALMDPPSLDPPPDDAYGRSDAAASFAGTYKNRRAMIFFGANDGMIHAVDARTGYEVWAFIPYNLLPKLRTLLDGQPVEQFDYFVDSSPKIAEVKVGGVWRSMLIIGQGPGGTFYQAFDVTAAGMGVDPTADSSVAVSALLGQFDSPDESIRFSWAFPNYSSFNPAYTATFVVTDGTAGGRVKIFGDLRADAPVAEKTVGYTWSDPAVGALDAARTTTAVIVGSGYFPPIETLIPSRGENAPRAGNAMYLIDIATGRLLGNGAGLSCPAISSGSGSGSGCVQVPDVANNERKNALQADPTAAGENGSYVVRKAYIGDIDGRYWRFNFSPTGGMTVNQMIDTGSPIYASSALLFIGSADVYMFFSTGSDILPSSAPGGTGTFKLYGLKDNYPAAGATTKFSKNLAPVTDANGLATGERPSTAPSVAGDIVFYTTTVEAAAAPCADFSANLYALTFVGGAAYDANSNGRIDNNESTVVRTVAGRATAPFIVDQHLYFGTSKGSGSGDGTTPGGFIEAFGDPEDFNNGVGQVGVRILSWREIR